MAVYLQNDSQLATKNALPMPSNYSDGSKTVIAQFRRAVQIALEDQQERDALVESLKRFESSYIVEDLMDDLKNLLDHPEKRILYKYISPLIPRRLRGEYKSLVPHIPSFERKVIRMKLQGASHSFGFTVRGGKEFGCGIFVTNVSRSSKAAQANLKAGYQIVRLNGLILSECTHEEFVSLVKQKKSLVLAIKVVGLIPEKPSGSNMVVWREVVEKDPWRPTTRIGVHGPIQSTRRIQVTLSENETLGASVKASSAIDGGVLIRDITPNSPADIAGLKRGDEIIHVNETSLLGKTLNEATRILRSSDVLMLTIRVDEGSARNSFDYEGGEEGGAYFDFDVHALSSSHGGNRTRQNHDSNFELRTRSPPNQRKMTKQTSVNRVSVTDSDVEQSRFMPTIAPATFGHGRTLPMPTLMGLGTDFDVEESHDFDAALMRPSRDSSEEPVAPLGRATVEGRDMSPTQEEPVVLRRQTSALKKPGGNKTSPARHPIFDDNIQIIPGSMKANASTDTVNTRTSGSNIHPSNLTFSQDILEGRQVQHHTIPKSGPLKLAIRGGRDTPLGPKIIISRIIEGGAAHSYGKLNVGDQVLVCDGVSLVDVSHDEAGEAFKRAMDSRSGSIDLVVAVNPEP
uniref:PDZ domain-containing protein n=1 Tax=Amphimedon queenslandica TaxID=400682 RepID=A0A1X7V4I4_AMPQE